MVYYFRKHNHKARRGNIGRRGGMPYAGDIDLVYILKIIVRQLCFKIFKSLLKKEKKEKEYIIRKNSKLRSLHWTIDKDRDPNIIKR